MFQTLPLSGLSGPLVFRALLLMVALCLTLTGCATSRLADNSSEAPEITDPFTLPLASTRRPTGAGLPVPAPRPTSFEDLPGWDTASLTQAIQAFRRSCGQWEGLPDSAPIATNISYAGRVGEWRPACAAVEVASDSDSARRVFEALFTPLEVLPIGTAPRFTGYFEPEIEARLAPVYPYTQPVPGLPDDLVQVEASQFGGKAGSSVPAQRLPNGALRPYPPRAEIVRAPKNILGYAHPGDVFFLQIQGSGRLRFEDGSIIRAAYAAHNGQPFQSTANYLIRSGKITRGEASMQGIRAWMDRVSRAEAHEAMNANPRFVFFRPLAIGDPELGPEGAQSVPLTPFGSMAIDPSVHAMGVPFFVQTSAPGLGGNWAGLLVAQDTGGAIKGRVRGDIYYGTGDEAGARAGTQNAPGRMWAFLPRAVAARIMPPSQDEDRSDIVG